MKKNVIKRANIASALINLSSDIGLNYNYKTHLINFSSDIQTELTRHFNAVLDILAPIT